jgi:hypothetical protein
MKLLRSLRKIQTFLDPEQVEYWDGSEGGPRKKRRVQTAMTS